MDPLTSDRGTRLTTSNVLISRLSSFAAMARDFHLFLDANQNGIMGKGTEDRSRAAVTWLSGALRQGMQSVVHLRKD